MARRRRFHYDSLTEMFSPKEPRWLKVCDRTSEQLSSRRLEPGTDLRAVLRAEAAKLAADGWIIEGLGAEHWTGNFFANRCGERWFVMVVPCEEPAPMHEIPMGWWSPGWKDRETKNGG